MENGAVTDVHGELAVVLDDTGVGAVARRHERPGEINDIPDFEVFDVFFFNRRRQDFLAHSVTPLCVKTS